MIRLLRGVMFQRTVWPRMTANPPRNDAQKTITGNGSRDREIKYPMKHRAQIAKRTTVNANRIVRRPTSAASALASAFTGATERRKLCMKPTAAPCKQITPCTLLDLIAFNSEQRLQGSVRTNDLRLEASQLCVMSKRMLKATQSGHDLLGE